MSEMKAKPKTHRYEGEELDVIWDGRLCIHVGECGRAEGELFVAGRQPWCQPDLAEAQDAVDVVLRCPTGALNWESRTGGAAEVAPARNTVLVANNGPLYASGDLRIEGAPSDMPGVRFRAALCRCGRSSNKPFCDNSHEEARFVDRGAIGSKGAGLEQEGGELSVKPAPNGPLVVRGNLTLLAASGREAWKGSSAALCRCGASENKPFCDGAHARVGFEAD